MTIRVGILGTGWGTNIQVPAFRQAGLEVVALWGRTEEKARDVAAGLNIPFASADDKDVLRHPGVDLVSVASPPHLHARQAILALEAGKHVLAEKPTALDSAEARQMLEAAKAHPGRLALIDHELRFLPTRQRMKELIQDGYIGEVFTVEGVSRGGGLLNPQRKWNWWSEAEKGGGLLGAIGSHFVDALTWLIGRRLVSVSADLRTFIQERTDAKGQSHPVTSDDYAVVQMQFEGAVSGTLSLSGVVAGPPAHRLVVAGSRGSLVYDDQRLTGRRLGTDSPEDLTVPENLVLPLGLPNTEWARGTVYLAQALRAALEGDDSSALAPAATFADGLHIQEVLDAARESTTARSWVGAS